MVKTGRQTFILLKSGRCKFKLLIFYIREIKKDSVILLTFSISFRYFFNGDSEISQKHLP